MKVCCIHVQFEKNSNFNINFILGVPSVTLSQTSFSASYGDDATLGCIISSNPTYTSVYWQKIVTGETPTTIDVSNTAKYSGSTVANPDLTIRNIGSGDIANYVCFAANSVGTGRSNQGPLNVLGSKFIMCSCVFMN